LAKTATKDIPVFTGSMSIESIYGYQKGSPVIEDHPEFPNPRTTPTREIVDGIKEAGKFDHAVTIFQYEGLNIPLDGKTRLTGAAEYRLEKGEGFDNIPVTLFEGSYEDAILFQIRAGLPGNRKDLTEQEVARSITRMLDKGTPQERIMKSLGWSGKGGTRKYNTVMAVLNSSEELQEVFQSGEITLEDAADIARDETIEDKAEVAHKLAESIKSGLSNVEARKEAGITQKRATVWSYSETIKYAADLLIPVLTDLEGWEEEGGEDEALKNIVKEEVVTLIQDLKAGKKVNVDNRIEAIVEAIDEHFDAVLTKNQLEMAFKFLNKDGSLRANVDWLVGELPEQDQKFIPAYRPN
jgi:hypothetical protein